MTNFEKHCFTRRRFLAATAAIVTLFLVIMAMGQTADAKGIEGTVMLGHQPMAGVTVTLWRTAGEESPESLREATTDSNGRFAFHVVMARADGNVWVANNWNDIDAVGDADPARPTSTWGGGSGIVVICGVAAPVKTPLMGPVRRP